MPDDRPMTTDRVPIGDATFRELAFLHEIAQLATQARDWDELMRSIVDGTTAAMDVEVCSFYLADHERTRLTLAATNGLDRDPGRSREPGLGRGHHRPRRRGARADRGRGRDARRAVRVGPRLRHRGPRRDAVGAAGLARRGRRRPQCPDAGRPSVRARRDRSPPDDRRAARRDRREGPAHGRGRGAARPAHRPRRGAGGAAERRDPRAADAAVDRPRLRRPARPRPPREPRADASGLARRGATTSCRASTASSTRSWRRSAARG